MIFFKIKILQHIFLEIFILLIAGFFVGHFIISPSVKAFVLESTEQEKIDELKNSFILFDLLKDAEEKNPIAKRRLQIMAALNKDRLNGILVFSSKGDVLFSEGKKIEQQDKKDYIWDRISKGDIYTEYVSGQNEFRETGISFPDYIVVSVPNIDRHISELGGIYAEYDLSDKKVFYRQLYIKNLLALGGIAFALFAGLIAIMYRMNDVMKNQKKVEDVLRKAKDISEDANRHKSEFLSNMRHEIRTPISAAIGMIDLVLHTDLMEKQRKYLEMAQTSIQTLLALFNDILDFSKIEAGNMKLEYIDFDIRRVVRSIAKIHLSYTEQKKLDLTYSVTDDVPQKIYGDSRRLYQVIFNLVKNAIKFTDMGGITIHCEVWNNAHSHKSDTDHKPEEDIVLHFFVKDTGIGIEADKIETVFDSFTQADGSSVRKYNGVGLGLSICKKLVVLMGGDIWVESVPGKGSTFHFTFKAGLVHEDPQKEKESDLSADTAANVRSDESQVSLPSSNSQHAQNHKTIVPSAGVFDLALAIKENNESLEEARTSSDYFVENVLNRIKKLEDVFQEKNYNLLEKEAGEIKRMALKAGAKKIANDAFRLELDIRKGQFQDVSGKFAKMEAGIEDYKEELNEVKWDEMTDV